MKTNFPEIKESNIVIERNEFFKQENLSLGPDDLVEIKKKEFSNFRFSNTIVSFFHHLLGFEISSEASFPAYFSEYIYKTQNSKKSFFSNKLKVYQGMLYLWDSFSLKEVILKVTEHGVHDDIDCKQNVEIKEEDWRNIKLSSILRFYRGGQPLLFFLISTQFVENDHYYIYGKPAFTKEEIDYCALFHIPTEDFQLSLGFALIMNFSIDFIQDFLLKYDYKLPNVLRWILRNISTKTKFSEKLFNVIKNHITHFPDDIEVAYYYFEILLNLSNQNEECQKEMEKILPIFNNSLFISPFSSLSLSQYYLKQSKFNETLLFLNLVTLITKEINYSFTLNQDYKTNISIPLNSIHFKILQIFQKIIENVGDTQFLAITKTFIKHKKKIVTKRITKNLINSFLNYTVNYEDNLKFLFDPGIESDFVIPSILNKLPVTDLFHKFVQITEQNYHILTNRVFSKDDVLYLLILSIETNQDKLFQDVQNYLVQENNVTGFEKLLLYKGYIDNMVKSPQKIYQLKVKDINTSDQNALIFIESIVKNLEQLNL